MSDARHRSSSRSTRPIETDPTSGGRPLFTRGDDRGDVTLSVPPPRTIDSPTDAAAAPNPAPDAPAGASASGAGAGASGAGARADAAPDAAAPTGPTPGLPTRICSTVALVAVAICWFAAAADVVPDDPIVSLLTPIRLVVLLGLGAGLAAAVLAGRWWRPWRTVIDPAVLVLLAAAGLATYLAGQSWPVWRGFLTAVAVGYLAQLAARVVRTPAAVFGLLALTGVAVAAFPAVHQWAADRPTGFCRAGFDAASGCGDPDAGIRVIGTFSNPNLLAAFLVLALPLAWAGVGTLADRAARTIGWVVLGAGYLALVLTLSRAPVLAAAASLAVLFVLHRPTRARLIGGAAGIVAVVAAAVVAVSQGFGVRTDIWSAAVQLGIERPLGWGVGRAGPLIDRRVGDVETTAHAHNLVLNWLVEAGVVGAVAVVVVLAAAIWVTFRAARAGSWWGACVCAALVGFAVLSLADHPANAQRLAMAMWLLIGLAAALAVPDRGRSRHAALR